MPQVQTLRGGLVQVTVVEEIAAATTVVEPVERVTVIDLGVAGPSGPGGPDGPPGPQGPASAPIQVTLSAATSFLAEHTFTWRPVAWFVGDDGEPIIYGVEYPDSAHVYVQFPTPFTGTMYLR